MNKTDNRRLAMYFKQIHDCIDAIDEFTCDINSNIFVQDRMIQSSVNMMMQVIERVHLWANLVLYL